MLSARRLGVTVRDMAVETGVGEKTIRRDLVLFQNLGFPLEEEVGEFGRKTWKMDGSRQLPLGCTFDEAVALHMSRQFLEPLAGTYFWEAAQEVFGRIRASFNERALEYLARFHELFHHVAAGAGDYSKKACLIDDLSNAIKSRMAVHITYQSQQATEPATRDVHPYAFVYYRYSLYLVAFAPIHGAIRHYKVDRIEAVDMRSQFPFQRPADFNIADHLAGSFGIYHGDDDIAVAVRFLPGVARYVQEKRWHGTATYAKQRDGSLIARFRLSTVEEFKAWVLSFGANAIVLEPASLRDRIARELEATLNHYQEQATKRS
jgi:proteasome accessory factor B